ncbi:hypothetical protein Avbf_16304 [Armadillidium vulgare]|nr:hypothetical protein Avbf_16304 [Armadillidium vulgare]
MSHIKCQLCLYFQVDRYESILSMLNLIDKKIDYLKMDVEGSEIDFLEDVLNNSVHLLNNVKQIGMEIHPLTPPETEFINCQLIFKFAAVIQHKKHLIFPYLFCPETD